MQVRVECLNRFHFVGKVLVDNPRLAADWVRRMAHPQFRLTFDTYHQQRGSGELLWSLETYFDLIAAVHIGDAPSRQEPGTGEINFANIARKLADLATTARSVWNSPPRPPKPKHWRARRPSSR